MAWSWAALMPHPPIIVPEVGSGREKAAAATLEGTGQICSKIREINQKNPPEVLLLLSPHESYAPGVLYINSAPNMRGSLARFGAPKVQVSLDTSAEDLQALTVELSKAGIPFGTRDQADITADHASLVPLYFLAPTFPDGKLPPVIVGNPCGLSMDKAVSMGRALRSFTSRKRWAYLASGDLSHRLKPGAPSGYHPDGQVFDKAVVDALKAGDPSILAKLPSSVLKNAGECGLRPTLILLGLSQTPLEVFSYEGPFGVGYCNALWSGDMNGSRSGKETKKAEKTTSSPERSADKPAGEAAAPPAGEQAASNRKPQPSKVAGIRLIPRKKTEMPSLPVQAAMLSIKHASRSAPGEKKKIVPQYDHPYAHLARKSIEAKLTGKEPPSPADIEALSKDKDIWKVQKGCFVSIKNKNGSLRGCIGTFGPTRPDIAAEIMQNSLSAALHDPRFPPMKAEELDKVDISVDVLNPPELLTDTMELDPAVWGVIVAKGPRRGLLLPDLPSVTSVEQQLTIASQKGGITDLENAEVRRFTISRHLESKAGEKA